MNGETILTWNVANWFTVIVMAALGFAAIGLIAHTANKVSNKNAAA